MNPTVVMQLATFVEFLLMTRHYCCVPGLGVWMSKDVPSHSENVDGCIRLTPPHREITFSSQMLHDDGVLITLVMESVSVSYDDATAWINREVKAVISQLDYGPVAVGHIGSLLKINGQISFETPAHNVGDPASYGLETITLTPWKSLENASKQVAANSKEDAENYHITLPKQWIHKVAVAVLIVCAMFANMVPSFDSRNEQANIVNTDFLRNTFHLNTLTRQSWDEAWEDAAVLDSIETENALTPLVTLNADTTQAVPGVWKEVSREGLPDSRELIASSVNGKLYYIIVASCSTEANARAELQRLSNGGRNEIGILAKDGRFRLYINLFSLKPDAEQYLLDLRQNECFKDAWLLPVKADALSQIKKDQDNGNYLSVELSNVDRGSESDQG